MVTKRIIPCLDIKNGKVVKGINFEGIREVGDAVEMGKRYSLEGADELVFLDITATLDGRRTFAELVEKIALNINIPFTVGGGISSLDDASRLLDAGADKVSVNSSAIANPSLIDNIAGKYGSQFCVLAIDARNYSGKWVCTTHGGTKESDKELYSWAKEGQDRGAGEILFTSMDHDGTKQGYACEQYKKLNSLLNIPVIASGGAGNIRHIAEVLQEGYADAALAASIFHYNEISIGQLKDELFKAGIPVRRTI